MTSSHLVEPRSCALFFSRVLAKFTMILLHANINKYFTGRLLCQTIVKPGIESGYKSETVLFPETRVDDPACRLSPENRLRNMMTILTTETKTVSDL